MMALTRRRWLATTATAALLGAAHQSEAETIAITGAGSSVVNATMQAWIKAIDPALGVKVQYDPVGSGAGQNQVLGGEVDFAASDLAVKPETLQAANLLQFPVAFSATVPVVNIPGVAANQLTLSAALLAEIFGGTLKQWNDPKIVAANPGLALPALAIQAVYEGRLRGGLVGSTHVLGKYLLLTNADWRAKYGAEISGRWTNATMMMDDASVLEQMKITTGAMGIVTFAQANAQKLATARMQNKAGKSIAPNAASVGAAVAAIDWAAAPDLVVSALDLPGEANWPIVTPTYALIPTVAKTPARGHAVRSFFINAIANSAAVALSDAAPLPPAIQAKVKALLEKLA